MKILVCNAGSTSLKFKLYDMPAETVLAKAGIERVGSADDALFHYEAFPAAKNRSACKAAPAASVKVDLDGLKILTYEAGIELFLQYLTGEETGVIKSVAGIDRVGFKPTLSRGHYGVHEMNEEVLAGMEEYFELSPVHNSAYMNAVAALRKYLPETLFVGAFETDFHRSIPMERCMFGIPYEWFEKYGIRRLGYHGASHGYIAEKLNAASGGSGYAAISCHLGGSGSICAIENGKSVDTSFGMSLESGLIHANRVGDMDASIADFLQTKGLSPEEIREGIRKKGGILGISGVSGDLRYVIDAAEKGNERARLAVDTFVTGIVHYIGAFFLDLGKLDYLVFTAGIGERSAYIRRRVCEKLLPLGVILDEEKNTVLSGEGEIQAADSKVKILVIPANEELGIARKTFAFRK